MLDMFQFWFDFVNNLKRKDDSSQVAAGRLKGAVFLDRLSLSPGTLDDIRNDVVRCISRYLVIDESAMTLAVQAQGRTVALAASIPVLRPRYEASFAPRPGGQGGATGDVAANDLSTPLPTADGSAARRALAAMTPQERARVRALRRKRQLRRP